MSELEQRNAFRLWNLIVGFVIGLAAVLSLPIIYGDLGGDSGFINWFTIFIGAFLSGILLQFSDGWPFALSAFSPDYSDPVAPSFIDRLLMNLASPVPNATLQNPRKGVGLRPNPRHDR